MAMNVVGNYSVGKTARITNNKSRPDTKYTKSHIKVDKESQNPVYLRIFDFYWSLFDWIHLHIA